MIPKRRSGFVERERAMICIICMDLGGNLGVVIAWQKGRLDDGSIALGYFCVYDETKRRPELGANGGLKVRYHLSMFIS